MGKVAGNDRVNELVIGVQNNELSVVRRSRVVHDARDIARKIDTSRSCVS